MFLLYRSAGGYEKFIGAYSTMASAKTMAVRKRGERAWRFRIERRTRGRPPSWETLLGPNTRARWAKSNGG